LLFNFKVFDFYEIIYVDDVLGQKRISKLNFVIAERTINVLVE
jgi:hypothetical protein